MAFRNHFSGKTAIVSGAASGIGKELTKQLLENGALVTAADIDEEGLKKLRQELANSPQLTTTTLDVTNRSNYEQVIQNVKHEHGQLDFIFNNAGIAIFDEVRSMTPEQWDRIIDINIRGVVNGTHLAYQIMCEQKSGHIVNTASGAGLMPIPLMTAYCMTKHAVVGLSTSLRNEAKRHNVNVSVICPGVITTNIFQATQSHQFDIGRLRKKSKVNEVPVEKAVHNILREVSGQKMKIVFPFSIKASEKFYALAPELHSKLSQLGINQLLNRLG